MNRFQIVTCLVCATALGCRGASATTDGRALTVLPLFGPVVSREVIGGRAGDRSGNVLLLAGGESIVSVDLSARVARRTPLAIPRGDSCWGLARLEDGSVWTLRGRSVLAEVGRDGRMLREIRLAEPHFGLYASRDRLVYQPARFVQAGPLLQIGVPGDPHPTGWSAIEPRAFPTLARASAAALNMVACGTTQTNEQPCWFPDDTAVALVTPSGETRRLLLSGLTRVAPEVLLTSDNPPRPLRDVSVDRGGSIWVLSSGTAPPHARDEPGGWLLGHYTGGGALVGLSRLTAPVRVILRAEPGRVLVLTGDGMVGEVVP